MKLFQGISLTVDFLTACSPNPEDTRLRTPPRIIEGAELIGAIRLGKSYSIFNSNGSIATSVESRYAIGLVHRGMVNGKWSDPNPKKRDDEGVLHGLVISAGFTLGNIKNVMRLKPARICISNPSTVVEVGPLQYWHVPLLGMLKGKGVAA